MLLLVLSSPPELWKVSFTCSVRIFQDRFPVMVVDSYRTVWYKLNTSRGAKKWIFLIQKK